MKYKHKRIYLNIGMEYLNEMQKSVPVAQW